MNATFSKKQLDKAYKRLKKWRKTKSYYAGSQLRFKPKFKKLLVKYMSEANMSRAEASEEFGLYPSLIMAWERKYGEAVLRTCYLHGERKINDVRTRSLAVKEHLEDGVDLDCLAQKYGVKQSQTVKNWVEKYKDNYKYYIRCLPDGVPYISQKISYEPFEEASC